MGIGMLILTAIGLAMDAFAVSVSNGMMIHDYKPRYGVRMGLCFGAFQFMMPLLGYFLGIAFADKIQSLDHWVAFILLAFIGGKMLIESLQKQAETTAPKPVEAIISPKRLLIQGIATSIDALAIGVSFALLSVNIWIACATIGVVSFVLSFAGGSIGNRLGALLGKRAELLGGLILIGIGLKILIEHLFFGG